MNESHSLFCLSLILLPNMRLKAISTSQLLLKSLKNSTYALLTPNPTRTRGPLKQSAHTHTIPPNKTGAGRGVPALCEGLRARRRRAGSRGTSPAGWTASSRRHHPPSGLTCCTELFSGTANSSFSFGVFTVTFMILGSAEPAAAAAAGAPAAPSAAPS